MNQGMSADVRGQREDDENYKYEHAASLMARFFLRRPRDTRMHCAVHVRIDRKSKANNPVY